MKRKQTVRKVVRKVKSKLKIKPKVIKKVKHKTMGKLKAECQKQCNAYIRLRDHGKRCVSCNEFKVLQAGHYYAVKGYDSLRFNTDNIHGECAYCNGFNESHLIGYGKNIEKRIGRHAVVDLDVLATEYKMKGYCKRTRAQVLNLTAYFKDLIKCLS